MMIKQNKVASLFSDWKLGAAFFSLVVLALGCASRISNRDPVGERFPAVAGEALDGKEWKIPGDLAGKPAILMIGYVQDSQFDIDRWLLGFLQAETPVPFLELPTIKGLMASAAKGSIDEGMRKGIPEEDWHAVVTLWSGDAKRVVALTGNERPRNARVVLLDADGRVAWFADGGYSAREMVDLDKKARELLAALPNEDRETSA